MAKDNKSKYTRDRVNINRSKSKNKAKKSTARIIVQVVLALLACFFMAMIIQEEWLRERTAKEDERLAELMAATPELTLEPLTPKPVITPKPIITAEPTEVPTPSPRPIQPKFATLMEENADIAGWIKIDDTVVDYPVVQDVDDNEHYLHVDFNGNESKYGTIYIDSSSVYEPLGKHIIIYGHRMADGKMFKTLVYYGKESFLREHPTIQFDTLYENMEWEIFSVHIDYWHTIAMYDETFESDEDWLSFIQNLQDTSMHDTSDIVLNEDDVVISLVTCTYEFDNARYLVHARLKK